MFKSILTFELKYWAKNPSLYFYGIILFLFAMLSVAGNAGLFNQTQSGEKSIANSPFALYSLMLLATKLMLLLFLRLLVIPYTEILNPIHIAYFILTLLQNKIIYLQNFLAH